MQAYIIRRLLLIIPTMFLVTVIVFLLVRLIPGNVIDIMLQEMTSGVGMEGGLEDIDREAIMHRLGLDLPIHVQYGRWVGGMILHGSLGDSLRTQRAATEMVAERIPVTVEIGLMALLLGLLIAIPLGIYSAIRQDTWGDYLGRSIAIGLIAIPGFWIGTMIMVFPSIWWHWTPPMEYIHLTEDPLGNIGMLIIPAVVLGTQMSGATMRMTRTMMLEVLRQDYIRTAWSKGLKERLVVTRHALKNALIPVVTIVGLQLPIMIGGTVIIEQIFNLPGVGRLMLDAINKRDYTIVSAVNLIIATFVLVNNLVVDLTYGYLDPRVRYRQ